MADGSINRSSPSDWAVETTNTDRRNTQATRPLSHLSDVRNTGVADWLENNRRFMEPPPDTSQYMVSARSPLYTEFRLQPVPSLFHTGCFLPSVEWPTYARGTLPPAQPSTSTRDLLPPAQSSFYTEGPFQPRVFTPEGSYRDSVPPVQTSTESVGSFTTTSTSELITQENAALRRANNELRRLLNAQAQEKKITQFTKFNKIVEETNSFLLRNQILSTNENPLGQRNPQLSDNSKAFALIRFAELSDINIADPGVIKELAAYTRVPVDMLQQEASEVIYCSKRLYDSQQQQSSLATIVPLAEDLEWQRNKYPQSWSGSTVSSTTQLNRTTAQLNLSTEQLQSNPAFIIPLNQDMQRQPKKQKGSIASSTTRQYSERELQQFAVNTPFHIGKSQSSDRSQQQLNPQTNVPLTKNIEWQLKHTLQKLKHKHKHKESSSLITVSSTAQLNLSTAFLDPVTAQKMVELRLLQGDDAAMGALKKAAEEEKNKPAVRVVNKESDEKRKEKMSIYSNNAVENNGIDALSLKSEEEQLELIKIMIDIDDPDSKPVMNNAQKKILKDIFFLSRRHDDPTLTGSARNALADMLLDGDELLLARNIKKKFSPNSMELLMKLIPQTPLFRQHNASLMILDKSNKPVIYNSEGNIVKFNMILYSRPIAVVLREEVQNGDYQHHALWTQDGNIAIEKDSSGVTTFGEGIQQTTFESPSSLAEAAIAALRFRKEDLNGVFWRRQQWPEIAKAADATAALIPAKDLADAAIKAKATATACSDAFVSGKSGPDAAQLASAASSAAAHADAVQVLKTLNEIQNDGEILFQQVRTHLLKKALYLKENPPKK
ncbi:hypothetical protein N5923_14445 [Erwiniaceae bacterium BAC15a-03b]|uniref:Uncharacterized protein n=1 Tax=Winslowiella arboricola TaxID=2978220 RepID=A0A9J6PV66_9GAMM|nr:hypothetical protein [Winslowiella arboricola]MCU5772658.1 hypothetical protein [Winslowiella arboricola]MCU5778692.1 hypothetical protein [Winslowiella arboricola]